MAAIIEELMPNVWAYRVTFWESCQATLQMFVLSGIFSFVLGLAVGVLLTVSRPEGIAPNRIIFRVTDVLINIFRSIPFIILLIFIIPVTRFLAGTAIGVRGAVVPLVFGTVPFYARQVETALAGVAPGKIEAARSMGTGPAGLIFKVYLYEAVPELIRVTTITAISLIGLTTMAVGAGGIGSFAINYGQNLHHQDIVNVCVIVLLVAVCILQTVGNIFARKTTNRRLFDGNLRKAKQ